MATATVTQARLREMLARGIGYYFSGTATGGSTTTVADTSADGFDARDDSETAGKWAHITAAGSAAPEFETRRVSSVSTTTATVDTAYSAAPASGDTYELLPYHTLDLDDAIQQAIRTVYPILYLPLRDETLVVDQLLLNGDMETFAASAFTNWSDDGSPTIAQETSRVFQGSNAASIAATGAAEGLTQNRFTAVNINEIVGKTLHFHAAVFATVASAARLRVSFDGGTTFTDGAYHAGDDEWEGPSLMYVDVAVPANATSLSFYLQVSSGNTAFFDALTAWIDRIERYTIPAAFINAPTRVLMQDNFQDPEGLYLPITRYNRATPGRYLRLEGMGRLNVPTTDSGTTQVDEAQAELIVARAARILFRRLAANQPTDREEHLVRAAEYDVEFGRLLATPGIRMMRPIAHVPNGGFSFTEDASGRYLTLQR